MPGTARTSRTPDEITTTLRHQPSHPHPLGRVFFNFNSPSNFNPATPTRRLDTPADEVYSLSPVRREPAPSGETMAAIAERLQNTISRPGRTGPRR
ncbi:hypothetical protein DFH11DRAFT_189275 [Phellopilus nigrolimitatus]|nr:hypothetical protein DFH11DRAFT_189275 [Phellopilus nigrolimitatus]